MIFGVQFFCAIYRLKGIFSGVEIVFIMFYIRLNGALIIHSCSHMLKFLDLCTLNDFISYPLALIVYLGYDVSTF